MTSKASRILFVFTSADRTLKNNPTGWYLPEAAHPYYVLSASHTVDFASPKGADPPVDPSSVESFKDDEGSKKFLADPVVQDKLHNTKKLMDVNPNDYDAIFYVGGHGPVIDLPKDPNNIKLAEDFYCKGKVVAAVCHGPAALVNVKGEDGKSVFDGKTATGFSNEEEEQVHATSDVPFLIEDEIKRLGGIYNRVDAWKPLVCVSGNLYTGQNPASGTPLAEEILKVL